MIFRSVTRNRLRAASAERPAGGEAKGSGIPGSARLHIRAFPKSSPLLLLQSAGLEEPEVGTGIPGAS